MDDLLHVLVRKRVPNEDDGVLNEDSQQLCGQIDVAFAEQRKVIFGNDDRLRFVLLP